MFCNARSSNRRYTPSWICQSLQPAFDKFLTSETAFFLLLLGNTQIFLYIDTKINISLYTQASIDMLPYGSHRNCRSRGSRRGSWQGRRRKGEGSVGAEASAKCAGIFRAVGVESLSRNGTPVHTPLQYPHSRRSLHDQSQVSYGFLGCTRIYCDSSLSLVYLKKKNVFGKKEWIASLCSVQRINWRFV